MNAHTSKRRLGLLALTGLLVSSGIVVMSPTADAAPVAVVGAAANTFVPPEVTVDTGGSLTFVNADLQPHDVTARETGANGQPLFRSATIGPGTAPVAGVESLDPGTYSFYCTVHDWMSGLLTVG